MTTNNQSTSIAKPAEMSAEKAHKILDQGMVRANGLTIHVFQPARLSDLEQSKTEDWVDSDIIVLAVKGNVKGPFGESFVCEVAQQPGPATHSLLLNHDGVLGRQLRERMDAKQIPFWASIRQRFAASGQAFYTFDIPTPIADAIEPPASVTRTERQPELEDLPF